MLAAPERTVYQRQIYGNAAQVDKLVEFPLLLYCIRNRKRRKAACDLHFCDNILTVVVDKQLPFCGVMLRQISCSTAVGLGGLAGGAEILDQRFTGRELLLVRRQAERLTNGVQSGRISAVLALQHRAAPLREPGGRPFSIRFEVLADTIPFKGGVVGVLLYVRIEQHLHELIIKRSARLRHVGHDRRLTIEGVAEEQDLEVRVLRVFIQSGLCDRLRAVGFDINRKVMHGVLLDGGGQMAPSYQTPMTGMPVGMGCPVTGSTGYCGCTGYTGAAG